MKIVLTGGGTGGHIYPALAIFEGIKKRHPEAEVMFIGANDRLEAKIIPEMDIQFIGMKIYGINRKNPLKLVRTLYRFIVESFKVRKVLKSYQPNYVIGTGGYVSGPVMYAASKLNIKTFILENDAVPGIANKFLSKYVTRIGVCFEKAGKYFPEDKTFFTGNPRAQLSLEKATDEFKFLKRDKKNVLVVLGSLGSETVNESIIKMINEKTLDYHFIFITGNKHFKTVMDSVTIKDNVTILEYSNQLINAFKNVDLVVTRGGATTLSELLACGTPSIVIPSPYVGNNEQLHNALELEAKNALVVLRESELTAESLYTKINELLFDDKKLKELSENASLNGIKDANDRIYDLIMEM